jgi:hypothetical protein
MYRFMTIMGVGDLECRPRASIISCKDDVLFCRFIRDFCKTAKITAILRKSRLIGNEVVSPQIKAIRSG